MTNHHNSASGTKSRIMEVAREQFAERGISNVTIREIAAGAGVTHPLVHRYFGSKTDIVAEILRREVENIKDIVQQAPAGRCDEALDLIRQALRYSLTTGRTSMLLMLRAQMDGLATEHMLEEVSDRPVAILERWMEERPRRADLPDPRVVAVVVGAATLGLAAAQPWLWSTAGLDGRDADVQREQLIDVMICFLAHALGLPCELEA
jgi:AcrR family transcriptional regulator